MMRKYPIRSRWIILVAIVLAIAVSGYTWVLVKDTNPGEGVSFVTYLGVGETIRIGIGRGGDKWKYSLGLQTTVRDPGSSTRAAASDVSDGRNGAKESEKHGEAITETVVQEIEGCSGWSEGGDLELTVINLWHTSGVPETIHRDFQDRPFLPLGVTIKAKNQQGTMGIGADLPVAPRSGGGGWRVAKPGDRWQNDRIRFLTIAGMREKDGKDVLAELLVVRTPK
ncbi:MAG: hypothetical protein NT031_00065 [Planctomycetota bacterium]|nr:hypothetical protein [Planctomycetota bacterium]